MFMRFVLSRFLLAGMMVIGVSSLARAANVPIIPPHIRAARTPFRASTAPRPSRTPRATIIESPNEPPVLKPPPSAVRAAIVESPPPAPQPAATQPAATQPVATQPVAAQPAVTQPFGYTPPDIPNDYDGAMQYGIASFQLGDFEKAKVAFTKVLYMYGHAQNPYAIGWLNAIKNARAVQTRQEQYGNRAGQQRPMVFQQADRTGRSYDSTVREIQETIKKGDNSFLYDSQIGQYDLAMAALEKALRDYPDDPLLKRLKDRTESKLKTLETRQQDVNEESRKGAVERTQKTNAGVSNFIDKLFGS